MVCAEGTTNKPWFGRSSEYVAWTTDRPHSGNQ